LVFGNADGKKAEGHWLVKRNLTVEMNRYRPCRSRLTPLNFLSCIELQNFEETEIYSNCLLTNGGRCSRLAMSRRLRWHPVLRTATQRRGYNVPTRQANANRATRKL
jgi:hypothetical protein